MKGKRFVNACQWNCFRDCEAVPLHQKSGGAANGCSRCIYEVPHRRWAIYMIPFSVFMMRNPLKPEEAFKAYAKNQVNEIWPLEKFAKHIADHNGVYSRGTVKGVLSDMCECLVEQLLNGNKIQLGELGTFGISISSTPAETLEKFTAKNIKAVNILFAPGDDFDNLVGRAEFNLVASRAAQNATLKAEKSNEKTVDLEAAKKKNNTSSGGADNSGKPSTPDGGGSGSGSTTTPTNPGGDASDGDDMDA